MKKITLLLSFLPLFIFAQNSGSLNPNYGTNGIIGVSRTLPFTIGDATLQGNKILISGRIQTGPTSLTDIILRYNNDGSIDRTFADNGIIELDESAYSFSYDNYIETFADGKFILCNNINYNNGRAILLNKYTVNGENDINFGTNGGLFLDYLPYNASVSNKPLIVPDASKVVLPITMWNSVGNSPIGSTLHKLESNGTIDNEFGDNGYVNFEGKLINSIDRNTYNGNWIDEIFGGLEGDMFLSMRIPGSQPNHYPQYVANSGAFTDNFGNSNFNDLFTSRFYETEDIILGTSVSLSLLTRNGNFYARYSDESPSFSYNTTMYNVFIGASSQQKPGFKVLENGNYILFGSKFPTTTDGNFVISKIGYNDNDGDGLTDDFGIDGVNEFDLSGDDRMIDCFEKPDGKIACVGNSNNQDGGLRSLSMVQVAANGNLDSSFGDGGIYLGNPYFKYNNGVLVTRYNGITGQPRTDWIGTATEPYSGKQRLEVVYPNSTLSSTLTRTLFNELNISNGISYIAFTNNIDAALVVGSVNNNNGNNNFMLYRTSIYGNEFGGLTNEIVQTDINNGSDDRATAAVIQDDNGVKKILVVGESDGNLAMVRYFADGADAGLVDTSFGNNEILNRSASQSLNAIPFVPTQVQSTADGTLYMSGEEIIDQEHRFSLKKFDANGTEDITLEAFDTLTDVSNVAQDFEILADGSFVVIGQTGNYETKIRKYNSDGSPDVNFGVNSYLYLYTGSSAAGLNDIIVLSDGRIAVVGYVDDEALVSLFDINGNLDSVFANTGVLTSSFNFDSVVLTSVEQVDENNILITGNSSLEGNSDLFTAQVLITNSLDINEYDSDDFTLYPNPTKDKLTIASNNNIPIDTVEFYDVLGKRILTISINFENIDVSKLALGTYFVKIKAGSSSVSKKLVIN